jgi:hypothetical protein
MIAAGIISACSPTLFTHNGSKVTQKNRMIPLKQGEQQGVWKTDELSVTYQYQMNPEVLKIAGTIELIGGFKIGFTQIKQLAVNLLFLDKQGIVNESPLIYTISLRAIDMFPMKFESMIPVPEGTQAISFAYDGELAGGGGNNGASATVNIGYSPSRP